MKTNLVLIFLCLNLISCAQIASRNDRLQNYGPSDYHNSRAVRKAAAPLDLDEKAKTKVNDAFKAIIENDDKKAKMAYGRSHKYMPEFIQFAFDLRFKNYEHAKNLIAQLPYKDEEKNFWMKIIEQKPKQVSKTICDELTAINYNYPVYEATNQELSWYVDIQELVDELYKSIKVKPNPASLEGVFAKLNLRDAKGNLTALNAEDQKTILNEEFFNKMRNAQRKDTRAWLALYASPLKAWGYERGFKPPQAYDLYTSLSMTEVPQKRHFMYRLKGIIKDMRYETLTLRTLGDKAIGDDADTKKAEAINAFKSRYLIFSTFLNLETALADCGLVSLKE